VVIADFMGMIGGYLVACVLLNLTTSSVFWSGAYQALAYSDVAQGLVKPFVFAILIALVGCHYGMATTGGTQGVGRATTQAVVASCVWIIIVTYFIGKCFIDLGK
jgi:phospholipid/cholesterol/gamma-HCH transport system permease protein